MNIRNILTSLILVTASLTAIAGGLDSDAVRQAGFSKLSEAEKAEVLKAVADKASVKDAGALQIVAEAAASEQNAKKADAWLNVGERIGKMIGGAAKEVGVAVNDFVKTPVGMVAMALIVWNYMGGVIVHVFGSLLVLAIGLGFVRYFAARYTGTVIKYDSEKRDIFGRSVKISETHNSWDGGDIAWFMIAIALVIIASLITMFTY
jgi:hypothetical protein